MSARRLIPAPALARLLDQTSRALHSLGYAADLFPAQWAALRYFAWAEPAHRTASALARFQGLAVGPVTRTVRTLMAKGYVANVEGRVRGRSRRVELTEAGRALLAEDPFNLISKIIEELNGEQRLALASALEHILRRVQSDQADDGEETS
ncbi:MarR family winged helix-turn-helix transcriptional regulator [Microvirga sp. VF16]|uniref:MarR family winged helix-turn-helix transcriptional regulator n=1 Tax=Microvirga sp. VF16 TaxID=2807101 RepID=UPI00193CE95B|nr:MarR family winged helix-turn-helix transcriptional regulator [Microvirga sp. VF16]QRM33122.1 winged helix-turn-helix transcriptional regulator [Microvirga sp. VF16]